ncbi:MAG: cell division protein FtsZ, partial [Gammaproteobacteria bacterium]|nr:cell division protein FtsZ [Gammaproteobacteria bacterium]
EKAQSHPYRVVQGSAERRAVDYESLDTPTVIRSRRGSGEAAAAEAETDPGMEYLDIPAFLRRQAD